MVALVLSYQPREAKALSSKASWKRTVPPPDGAVTVTPAVPLCPSLVAVIVAKPAATPVTKPIPLTVATPALLVAQVIVRPVRGFPLASFGVAVNCTVCPTWILAVAGLTVTDATGTFVAVTAAAPVLPSQAAVMIAVPTAMAATSPVPSTVATPALLLVHVTVRPVKTFPFASFGVAVSCAVCPISILAVAGLTVTEATGTLLTVTVAVPLRPSLVAVIVAPPATTPVTSPLPFTVATVPLLLDHMIERPFNGLPFESLAAAANCTVWPRVTLADAGLTVTDATGRRPRLWTREEPDNINCELAAVTRKSPATVSAVNTPSEVTVPPDVLQATATPVLSRAPERP